MSKIESAVKPFVTDPILQKRLAKYIVQRCCRNSVLEDLHAGLTPDSKEGDYSDIVVSTPYGQIPWGRLSRFNDVEMKALMIDVVQRTYEFVRESFDTEFGAQLLIQLATKDLVPQWEDPR